MTWGSSEQQDKPRGAGRILEDCASPRAQKAEHASLHASWFNVVVAIAVAVAIAAPFAVIPGVCECVCECVCVCARAVVHICVPPVGDQFCLRNACDPQECGE